jgi:hypothetical protein
VVGQTTNNDLVDNAFTDEGYSACVWFDNGNTGMLVQGNYFYDIASRAIQNETGYNSEYVGNLFEDVTAGIYLNDSGGWDIPGSNYNNEIVIQGNTFFNAQDAVDIWGASARSCLNSGEGAANGESDAYCSGGFPQMPPDRTVLQPLPRLDRGRGRNRGGQPVLLVVVALLDGDAVQRTRH